MPETMIPAKALTPLLAAAGDHGAEMFAETNLCTFRAGPTSWTVRPVAGEYVPWRQLIPKPPGPVSLTVGRDLLVDAIDRTVVLAAEENRPVYITPGDETISLSTSRRDVGEATVTIAAAWEGDRFEIGFNSTFLAELARAVTTDELTVRMIDPLKPAVVFDGAFTGLLMPARR
jgi:DNA polymerase-3 subunit beta